MKHRKYRYVFGVGVLILFQMAPLVIPFVWMSDASVLFKSVVSGALALGIPELGIVIAAMIIGKSEVQRIWRIVKVIAKRCYRYASSSDSL